jgi:hypothetical protein
LSYNVTETVTLVVPLGTLKVDPSITELPLIVIAVIGATNL